MALKTNDPAPDFSLKDSDEKTVSLSQFSGKWVAVYFYPKDNTPGCTIEALAFTNLALDFAKAGAMILGISRDSCESHMKFVKYRKIGITLLSDPEASIQKLYGVWHPKKVLGQDISGTVRTTFLVDPKGKITKILG